MSIDANNVRPGARGGWRIAGWAVAALLWLLPLAAMQFTDEVRWTASDFAFAAVMIGGAGGMLELAARRSADACYRGGSALLVATAFLLVWINAAVGIIGDGGNPLNLLYGGVIALALAVAAATRFRASGLRLAARAAAFAQGAVGIVAIAAVGDEPPGVAGLVVLHGVFVALLLLAARLFGAAVEDAEQA